MTDRVFPSAKQQNLRSSDLPLPPIKAQQYRPSSLPYRPQPMRPPRRRNCWCRCCCWMIFALLLVIMLVFVVGAIVWVLYHPERPSFSVSSLQLVSFNLTSSNVKAAVNLALTFHNPNRKLVFFYDPISVSASSGHIDLATARLNSFVQGTKNITVLRKSLSSISRELDADSAASLNQATKKNKLPLQIVLETKLKAKMGGLRTDWIKIRISCEGIKAPIPKPKSRAKAVSGGKCKVKLPIKLWRWQI